MVATMYSLIMSKSHQSSQSILESVACMYVLRTNADLMDTTSQGAVFLSGVYTES